MSPEKETDLESHMMQITVNFKSQSLFQKSSKLLLRYMHFQQQQKFSICFNFNCVKYFFYVYFGDSVSNFMLEGGTISNNK